MRIIFQYKDNEGPYCGWLYIDPETLSSYASRANLIVAIKPKLPFKPVFQVAVSREGSAIRIINEPYQGSSVFLVETGEGRTTREYIISFA